MNKPNLSLLPDVGDLIFLVILIRLLFIEPAFLFADGSTGWHIVVGRYIIANHSIPHQDLLSYTFAGAPWVDYEWLFGLFAASLDKLGGLNALAVAAASLIALVFLLLYGRIRRNGCCFPLAALLVVTAALASSVHWLARPVIFSALGVYIVSTTLEDFRRGLIGKSRLLITLALTMAVWVNLHPGFLFGFALILIYLGCDLFTALCSGERARGSMLMHRAGWLASGLVASFVAGLANPYGIKLYRHVIAFVQSSSVAEIMQEYASPVFHGQIQPTCLEMIFLFLLLGLLLTKKSASLPHLISCLFFAHLALSGVRHAPEFVIVAVPFIGDLFSETRMPSCNLPEGQWPAAWLSKLCTRMQLFNGFYDQMEAACRMHLLPVVFVTVLFIASVNGGDFFSYRILKSSFSPLVMPGATLECLRRNKLDPVHGFNFDNWGGYIVYKLGIPVFIDDRLDFYEKPFFLDYGRIVMLAPGWSQILERHHIQWLLLPKNAFLSRALADDKRWQLLCQDQAADLFIASGKKDKDTAPSDRRPDLHEKN